MDAISSSNFLILMIFLVIIDIFSLMFCSKRVHALFFRRITFNLELFSSLNLFISDTVVW